jgi:hypothetical protein
MGTFILLTINLLLVLWFGRGRIGDRGLLLFSVLSCLGMVLSRCYVKLAHTGGLVDGR